MIPFVEVVLILMQLGSSWPKYLQRVIVISPWLSNSEYFWHAKVLSWFHTEAEKNIFISDINKKKTLPN